MSDLHVTTHTKQDELVEAFFSKKYDTLIYGGARGGGKTMLFCILLILLCKFYPRSRWIVIRESTPSLKRTILETFWSVCPTNFLKKFNQTSLKAQFKNGSFIEFMSEDFERDPNLNRFRSLEANGVFFEQVEEINEKTFNEAYIISGRWKRPNPMPPRMVMASCNPADNWVKTRFWEPYRDGLLSENIFYLRATIADNPVLFNDKDYMKAFDNLDPLTRRLYLEGDWDAFVNTKAFLYSFSKDRHVSPFISPFDNVPIILSFDFNVEPFTCLIGQRDAELLWIYEEIQIDHSQGDDLIITMCREIKKKYPSSWYIVTGDASGRQRTLTSQNSAYDLIQRALRLTDQQMQVRRQNISLKDSRVLCNSVLSHFPLKIHPRCKTLVSECKSAQFVNGKLIKNRTEKKLDSLDAMRYMIDYALEDFLEFLKLEA